MANCMTIGSFKSSMTPDSMMRPQTFGAVAKWMAQAEPKLRPSTMMGMSSWRSLVSRISGKALIKAWIGDSLEQQ